MTVRTRFAPAPTGLLHIGNARAAFYSALFAKQEGGAFILRIEDTDVARSASHYVDSLQQDLNWLGIHWQEGHGVNGQYGPYWQSQRQAIYLHYYEELIKKNLTYPCFCSDEELALERKLQLSQGQAPRYRGTCLSLSAQEIEQRLAKGLKPTLRFRVPAKETILFQDLIKGPQSFNSADIGDFIIRRADGSGSFMFCNAIDDALMMVTQVLRGEDHLANTPRQLLLMKALGLHQPQYGHLAMITSEDGRPLSKREGSLNLRDLRERGYLSEALINYLGRLGHSYETSNLLSFEELAKHFQLKKISHSAARFDLNQLLYWQKIAVNALDTAALWKWLGEDTQKKVPENKQTKFAETVKPNLCFPEDAAKWAEIFFQKKLSFTPEDLRILREAGEQFFVEAEQALEVHGSDFKNIVQDIKKALKVSGKNLYMPLRIALTGQQDGPELVQIAELLGREGLRERFSHAFQIASGKQDAQTL